MNELLNYYSDRWDSALDHFKNELKGLRSNRATPTLIEDIKIDYYGTLTPLKQIATISTPEPRQLLVDPWDKNILKDLENILQKANSSFGIKNDGKSLRINLPQMTEESRKETVNILHVKIEEARVAIRRIREDVLKKAKQLKESSEISEDEFFKTQKEIQAIVDKSNNLIKTLGDDKEKEIMTI